MSEVVFALRWYLVVQVFGLAALPLSSRLLRHLPDRGYGVSKPLGLLLSGWAFWFLTTLGWTRNTSGGILVALALLLIAGIAIQATRRPDTERQTWADWRPVLACEVVFVLTFAGWCVVRAHMPRIETAGGEKWMEIAFLRAILRSGSFPPHDPWLSGFGISYYYFGYIIVAMLTRLSAVPASIAFNLAIASLFALTCIGAFSLVHNLVSADDRGGLSSDPTVVKRKKRTTLAVWGGVLGTVLLAGMGNLEGLLEVVHARGLLPGLFWRWLDIEHIEVPPVPFAQGSWVPTRFFWWWQSSRVLQDYTPLGAEQHVIDEFPFFSFLLGDMHPHVLGLPFVLLALALAFNLYLGTVGRGGRSRGLRIGKTQLPLAAWEMGVYAVCLGGLGFLNTWDFPIYVLVVVGSYALPYVYNEAPGSGRLLTDVGLLTILLVLPGLLLYLPFWIGFQSQAGGAMINLFNATRLPQFLVMFGPFVTIAGLFVAREARGTKIRLREVVKWTLLTALGIFAALALAVSVVTILAWLGAMPSEGMMGYLTAWLRGEPIPGTEDPITARTVVIRSLLSRLGNPWTALVLIAFLTVIVLLIRRSYGDRRQGSTSPVSGKPAIPPTQGVRDFVLLLFAIGTLLVLSVEYVFLRDNFGTRMNTVFKFYYQAWVVWAISGAYMLMTSIQQRWWRMMLVAGPLIVAGLVYPPLSVGARASEQTGKATLDGAFYLSETHPDDYAAISWLNANVTGAPVILEAPADKARAYVYEGRVSAHTGLPTLLGWAGHENQWRGGYGQQSRREPDIETLYTSTDATAVLALLDKYDVSYVYVGQVERARYPEAGLAKFEGILVPAFSSSTVTIYERGRE